MPETRSDVLELEAQEILDHWAMNDDARSQVARLARELHIDLTDADTFQDVFKVERLVKFPGDLDTAMRRLHDWAIKREHALIDRLKTPEPQHREAKTIAWTCMIAPDGTQVNVTAREGSSPDMVASTVLALVGGARLLAELGFVTQKTRK